MRTLKKTGPRRKPTHEDQPVTWKKIAKGEADSPPRRRASALLRADEIAKDLIRGAEARAIGIIREAETRAAGILPAQADTFVGFDGKPLESNAQRIHVRVPEFSGASTLDGTTSASGFLDEASRIVAGARNTTHGDKERSFKAIADMLNTYLRNRKGRELEAMIDEVDVANMWVLVKMARSLHGTPVRDHYVDMAGYAGIAGELATTSGRVKT